ncbi:MAG: IS3 family transposase [Clostridia bacterium]|nr:IS3 family transposase [Clostridia bacterium]
MLKRTVRNNSRKSKKKEIYEIIKKLSKGYKIKTILKISKMAKSSYYKWKSKEEQIEKKKQKELEEVKAIKELYIEHKGRYGVDRMTNALKSDKKMKCNHKKVYRLMVENGYLSVVKRKKKYKKVGKPHPKHNVLKRNFTTSCPYDKIATDVTEISMFGQKLYISPIKDLHTNMIESNEIGRHATLEMAIKMIEKIKNKSIAEGTIIHSDQGALYNSLKYQKILEDNNFIQSMSRKGTPIDNSPMESFFSTLKSEVIYNPLIKIENFEDLIKQIEEYIEYYNNKRIQKGLGYLTPREYKEKELARISMENVEN